MRCHRHRVHLLPPLPFLSITPPPCIPCTASYHPTSLQPLRLPLPPLPPIFNPYHRGNNLFFSISPPHLTLQSLNTFSLCRQHLPTPFSLHPRLPLHLYPPLLLHLLHPLLLPVMVVKPTIVPPSAGQFVTTHLILSPVMDQSPATLPPTTALSVLAYSRFSAISNVSVSSLMSLMIPVNSPSSLTTRPFSLV